MSTCPTVGLWYMLLHHSMTADMMGRMKSHVRPPEIPYVFMLKVVWGLWGAVRILLTWHISMKLTDPVLLLLSHLVWSLKAACQIWLQLGEFTQCKACFGTRGHCTLLCTASHIFWLISYKGLWKYSIRQMQGKHRSTPTLICFESRGTNTLITNCNVTMVSYFSPFSFRAAVINMTTNYSRFPRRLKTVVVCHTCPAGSKVVSTLMSSPENMQQLGTDINSTLLPTGPSLLLPESICIW